MMKNKILDFLKEKGAVVVPITDALYLCAYNAQIKIAIIGDLKSQCRRVKEGLQRQAAPIYTFDSIEDAGKALSIKGYQKKYMQVLDYLQKHGSITQGESTEMGVQNLTLAIRKLKEIGHDISSIEVQRTILGVDRSVKQYFL